MITDVFPWWQLVPALHYMQVFVDRQPVICYSDFLCREKSNMDLEIIPKHITVQDSRVSEACLRSVGPLKEIRDNNVWCAQRKRRC